jgi:3-dehydroquinate synthase
MIVAIDGFEQIRSVIPNQDPCDVLAIVDSKLLKCQPELIGILKGLKFQIIELAHDGDLKSLSGFERLLEKIFDYEINKETLLVAVGGGQLTDLVGFTASVLLRGIRWISVPSTFLGMIDAGIGGKTALDSRFGKNLIGTFHMPLASILYVNFLDTLPSEEISSGYGELIKYAILSPEIESLIRQSGTRQQLVLACAHFKMEITDRDPFDLSERRFLNLGHTIGHGLEHFLKIPHGIAVFWGIYWEHLAMGETITSARVLDIAGCLGFPIQTKVNLLQLDSFWPFIAKDKKKKNRQSLELPIVQDNGKKTQITLSLDEFYKRLANIRASTFS